jgi:LysM repeat protein
MKKLFLLAFSAIAVLLDTSAQTGQLMVKKGSKGFYVEHSVAPKEGLYAIGRLYSVHPKHIAAFNQIELNKGLEIGQIIQIPLSDTNFTQKTKKGQPIYYTVGEKEGLTKVSNANNKVALKDLRSWNGLTNDNPAAGTKLI